MPTTKPIRQVTKTITPAGSNLILLDDGISMGKATLSDGVSAVAGDLIDTAIDDLDLGTAAQSDAADFATAAQGTKADSAVQPGDIGTMATETASDYTKTADLAAVATSNDYDDLSNLPTLGTGAALDAPSDPDLSNDTDKLARRGDVNTNMLQRVFKVDTPDDIATATPPVGAPSINVLGYPTSPGASHDWVRADSEPSHPMKEQDANGQWWEVSPFTVKAEHFGTWGHNTDCSAALDNAMEFVNERQYGVIELPPGKAIISQSLVKTLGATTEFNLFGIRGSTRASTLLEVDAASLPTGDVLGFTQPSLGINHRISFRDFTIVANGVVDGYALVANRPAGGISPDPLLDVFNVSIRGKNTTTDHFTAGLDASGSLYPNIQWLTYQGAQNQGSTDYSDTSDYFAADLGINLDNTYGGWLAYNLVKYCKTGVSDVWSTSPAGEGTYFHNNNIVRTILGYKYVRSVAEPSNKMSGNHFNCRDVGIWSDGAFGIDYNGNSFYNEDTSHVDNHSMSPIATRAIDVYIKNAYDILLADNRHRGDGGNSRSLYYFDTGTNTTTDVLIRRPIMDGCTFTNLASAFSGQKVEIENPIIRSNSTNTGGQLLGGNHAKQDVGITYSRKKLLKISLSADRAIATSTLTSIIWGSEQKDDINCYTPGSSPQLFTVPARAGFRQCRIKLGVEFEANSTGSRQLFLYTNDGGGAAELSHNGINVTQNASSSGTTCITASSGWFDLVDGTTVEVKAWQNSGGSLNILMGGRTWLEAEFR